LEICYVRAKQKNIYRSRRSPSIDYYTPAFSEESRSVSSYDKMRGANLVEGSVLSKNYAKENDAIGISIGFGKFEGAADPREIGIRFQREFKKLGEDSNFFISDMEKPGFTIAFDHAHNGTEYMAPRKAVKIMKEFVQEKRRFKDLLTNDSAPTKD